MSARRRLTLIALCAGVLAINAGVASSAHALNVQAGAYPAVLNGTQIGAFTYSNGVREVTCAAASLTGALASSSTSAPINPSYSNCTGNASTTATVTTNGCKYTLHPTEGDIEAGTGTLSLDCPAGKSIVMDIWATGKKHTEAKMCRLEIPTQGPKVGLSYAWILVSGRFALRFTFKISTWEIIKTEGTTLNCGATSATKMINGTIDVTALNEGSPVDLFIA